MLKNKNVIFKKECYKKGVTFTDIKIYRFCYQPELFENDFDNFFETNR